MQFDATSEEPSDAPVNSAPLPAGNETNGATGSDANGSLTETSNDDTLSGVERLAAGVNASDINDDTA